MINLNEYNPPKLCGIYIFKDNVNNILYIGKAKNLYNRIQSYKTDRQVDWKIDSLIQKSTIIEWIITENEQAALLLEAQLISEQKPLFNKLLMNDYPFIYIIFKYEKNIPVIKISRYYSFSKDFIIGPFLSKKNAIELYDYILLFFNLFNCKKKISHGCLNYHIGKCSGSCREDFNMNEYINRYNTAINALKNEKKFLNILDNKIEEVKNIFDIIELEKLINYKSQYNTLINKLEIKNNSNDINIILSNINIEEKNIEKALLEIKNILNMNVIPTIIDCIDISHFQGHSVTGACVRFINGFYNKKNSIAYKLPFEENNDYKNLKLLIKKHYNKINYPDLLLIDGGKGQLNIINKLNLPIPLLALAKKEEMIFSINNLIGMKIDLHQPHGKLLIALRNATHNAAIGLHRKLFNKYNRK